MNRKPLIALTALATLALAAPASAQYGDDRAPLNFGGQLGVYLPTSGAVRDAFGSSVLNVGLSPVSTRRQGGNGLRPELNFITASKNGNRLFIGTLTLGIERQFGEPGSNSVPYARAFGGLSYIDFGINTGAGRVSDRKFGTTFGGEVGIVLYDRLRLAARYNVFSKASGFDFSGFSLSATYSLFRL